MNKITAVLFPLELDVGSFGVGLTVLAALGLAAWRERRGKLRLRKEIRERTETAQLLAEREREYREIFEGAPLAFVVWDENFAVRAWNRSAEKLFGWTEEEVLGKNFTAFLLPEDVVETVSRGLTTLKEEGSFSLLNQNRTKSGDTLWCQWHNVARHDADGRMVECHAIAADVTKQVETQHRLESDRRCALNASLAKDQLLAHTSHEIRNPLNAVMGYAQILVSDAPNAEAREMAQTVLEGAEAMLALLNDLLDSSKLEAGKMELDWAEVDLNDLVTKKAEALRQLVEHRGLSYAVHTPGKPALVQSDGRRIGQILSNLLGNAVKFTQEGGITVTLCPAPAAESAADPSYMIQVRDTGIGVEAEAQEKIFEPFVQANGRVSRDFGGTGLGLSLSKKLAEALGGRLSLTSAPGKGSCFTLTLPRDPHAANPIQPELL